MESGTSKKTIAKYITYAVTVICTIIAVVCAGSLVETVEKGTYDIIQRPVSGTLEAKMKPGMYGQLFADVKTWPSSETMYFTADADEGSSHDQSIQVRFSDGSLARISGTTRVDLPGTETEAIELMSVHNYKNYEDLEARLILPTIRRSLILTANLMNARESYSEKRPDFYAWAWDMIENGPYKTIESTKEVTNPHTGMKETVAVRTPVIIDGVIQRERNPLQGTGIRLANFEVKDFVYEERVMKQIDEQQKAIMAIATAKAQAEEAKQETIKAEEQGKAEAMKTKWAQEKINATEIAQAEKNKAVAELKASQELEVAKLEKLAAEETKAKEILLGEGEATRKELVMNADGALEIRLKAQIEIEKNWADAHARRQVPATYIASSGGDEGRSSVSADGDTKLFQTLVNARIASDIAEIKPIKK